MAIVHFLNVLEGDCNLIQHDSGRLTVIDVSNAHNDVDTEEEAKVRKSELREVMRTRTQVPYGKVDFKQKHYPDNPIKYLKEHLRLESIFRFVITHPDMDHLDGIRDLFEDFKVWNTWDSDNNKEISSSAGFGGYNKEDWEFYKKLRSGKVDTTRLTITDGEARDFWNQDNLKILCPSPQLVKQANESSDDFHDLSYVLLFTPPKHGGGVWKIVFAGDSHDNSWNYIIKNYKDEVSDVDVLFAPHHGRDSDRDYSFLEVLKPKVTLFGNAAAEHLAYDKYPGIRITNNQAGYVIIEISPEEIVFSVKNIEFAKYYCKKRGWDDPPYFAKTKSYGLVKFPAA